VDAPVTTNPKRNRSHRRTRWLVGALAVAVSLVLAPVAMASDAHVASGADTFVDSIGVNTHTFYTDTAYNDFEAIKAKLAELGVRHIRENLALDRPDQYERLNELAATGVKSTLILGEPSEEASNLEEMISIVNTDLGGAVDAVEGPNEFDMKGGPNWAAELREYQQRLYSAIKADPSLAALPVIGPSIVQRAHQEALGDVSGMLDYGNIHPYPYGEPPESNLSFQLGRAAANSGAKPVIATETGYHTALNWGGEHPPVSEDAMATYVPRIFLDYFSRGIPRTFSYELVDEKLDPANADRESNFGLLRNDFSPKPAFVALRNTIAILADPGPAFTPESLDYSVGGSRAGLHQVLLQKRDGSFYLALWRATSVWDPSAKAAIDSPSEAVTLSFDRQVKSAQRYLPNVSEASSPLNLHGGKPLTVNVGPQVVILRLTLGAHTQGRIRVWVAKQSVPAGGRVAVRGRLPSQAAGRSLAVRIQRWHRRGWRTVGSSRTSKSGDFRKKIRVPAHTDSRASRLRVVAPRAKPSKAVRLRIRY
jgi:hypothetical protein